MEKNIGKNVHFFKDVNDIYKHVMDDASMIAKEMEPHMQVLNLANPYDCEVAIAVVTSMLASLTTMIEHNFDTSIDEPVKMAYDFFKGEAEKIINERK